LALGVGNYLTFDTADVGTIAHEVAFFLASLTDRGAPDP